ncbi:hypothetical protein [Lysobacter sp. cf310]|uniref:hypothetical protein n=1 Tax=Lysobacter sp. cf310 TaxID=1761790 RepID=UPI001113C716|nr:hypothetical protein [Lysobacter sp. cf310]
MQQTSSPNNLSLAHAIGVTVVATVLGFGSGALMAWIAPSDKFSWAGLAVAPLWLLLEIYFEAVVAILGNKAKATRIASTIAVLAGFYIAWFALRGVAA